MVFGVRSLGSSTISSQQNQSLEYDDENPSSGRKFPSSPSIVKAPSVVRKENHFNAHGSSINHDPPSVAGETQRIQRQKDFLDRVFEGVEYTVCRVRPNPPEPPIIHKTVVVEDRQSKENPADLQKKKEETRDSRFAVPTGRTPKRSILKKENDDGLFDDLENPQIESEISELWSRSNTQEANGDLLDHIFNSVEEFTCRNRPEDTSHEHFNVDGNNENASPLKLHKLHKVPKTDEGESTPVKPYQKDALDYIFECGRTDETDEHLQIYPTRKEEMDMLDYMFECRGGDVVDDSVNARRRPDVRDPSFRAPMSPERNSALSAIHMRDNSIVHDPSNDSSLSRLEMLRNKKRQLESGRIGQVSSEEESLPYLVPRGYRGKSATGQLKLKVSDNALADNHLEDERNKRFRGALIAVIVMVLLGSALILVAISFFFPLGA